MHTLAKTKPTKIAQVLAWNRAHPERYKATVKRMMDRVQDRLDRARDKPCMDCGQKFPIICMDLDHRDPKTKRYPGLNMKAAFRRRPEQLDEELAKCDVVCANCHRIRTRKRWDAGKD